MEKTIPYPKESDKPESKRNVVSTILVAGVGIVSAVYLFNPTAGFIELIPDNIPGIGNLDEAAATAMLISALAYFGLDFGRLFGTSGKKKAGEASETVEVESEVVDPE